MKIIYNAPEHIDALYYHNLLFLAGPIQGSADWQKQAISYISGSLNNVIFANPRRDVFNKLDADGYNEQVDWESKYLDVAGREGMGIIFWIPKEIESIEGRSYAQTTRFELGEWFAELRMSKCKLYVGIEPGFSGEKYIRRKFETLGYGVFSSLSDLCQDVIDFEKIYKKY